MISKETVVIPGQRSAEISVLEVENYQLATAAQAVKAGELIVFENGPVMAIAGDANNPQLQSKIGVAKRDRSPDQPVGWISTFDPAAQAFKLDHIEDKRVADFLANPEVLTRRLGGLSFLRCEADLKYKQNAGLSDAIVPIQKDGEQAVEVQIYSPTGNARCSKFGRYTTALAVQLTMTSANYHTENEIVAYDEAERFAADGKMLFFPQYASNEKQLKPRGSYPVIRALPDRLQVIRYGFLEPQLIKQVLYDLPVDVSLLGNGQASKYPQNILQKQDLPKNAQELMGEDMRAVILKTFMEPDTVA